MTGENTARCPSPYTAAQCGQTGGPTCCGEKNTVLPVTTVSPSLPLASRSPVARSQRGPGPYCGSSTIPSPTSHAATRVPCAAASSAVASRSTTV
ncbi:hypothetical protein [Streptomyces sp. NPDC056549]|uniref:hypothetical protein n=1 Tax=Streptomyces sp. NPDC056549 TaxID=3345864 RepID=UPI0036B735D2